MGQSRFLPTLSRLLGYLRPHWVIVSVAVVCTVAVSGAKLSQSWFIGKIFGVMAKVPKVQSAGEAQQLLQTQEGQTLALQALNQTCVGFLIMMALMGLATYLMRYLVNLGGQLATLDMRNQVFAHVQRLPLRFFDQMRMGEIQSRASGDVVAATALFTQLADFLVNLLIVVIALGWMMLRDPMMTLSVLGLSPFIAVAIGRFGRSIGRLTETLQARGADLSSITYEGISSVRGIKAYGLEDLQTQRFQDKSRESFGLGMKLVSISASQSPIVEFLGALGIVAIVWLGAYRIVQGQVDLGEMSQYWALLVMTTQPITALSGFYSSFHAAAAAAERVFCLLDQPTEEQLSADLPSLPPLQGQIDFRAVDFGYSPDKKALQGLNLSIKPGETLAVVGSNGAGKSTLINLLARFYDPDAGQVLVDGHDLRHFNLASLRNQLGLVTQESILLGGTVAENIAMGRPGASQEEVLAAAQAARAHEFITLLPEGYASQIGERGSRLSGGQRQRIAIARALLRNPRILVLDEFTSGIDPESEIAITEAIEASLQGRTCLIIAHRFNTIRNADRIVVLDQGRIVECGDHEQLMAQDGLYRRIYQAQLQPKESDLVGSTSGGKR